MVIIKYRLGTHGHLTILEDHGVLSHEECGLTHPTQV